MGALPSRELWGPENLPIYPLPTPPGVPRPKRPFIMLIPVCDRYFYLTPGPDAWRPRFAIEDLGDSDHDVTGTSSESLGSFAHFADTEVSSLSSAYRGGGGGNMSDLMSAYYTAVNDERGNATFVATGDTNELDPDAGGVRDPKPPVEALFDYLVTRQVPFTFDTNDGMRQRVQEDPRHLRVLPCAIAIGFCDDPMREEEDDDNVSPSSVERDFYAVRQDLARRYFNSAAAVQDAASLGPRDFDSLRVGASNDSRWNLPAVELPDGCGSRGCIIGYINARQSSTTIPSTNVLLEQTLTIWTSPLVSGATIQSAVLMMSVQMMYLQGLRAGLVGAAVPTRAVVAGTPTLTHQWLPGQHLVAAKPTIPMLQRPDTSLFVHILTWTKLRHYWSLTRTVIKMAAQMDRMLPPGVMPLSFQVKDDIDMEFWLDPLYVDVMACLLLSLMRVQVGDDSRAHVGTNAPVGVGEVAHSPVITLPASAAAADTEDETAMIERGLRRMSNESGRQHLRDMYDAFQYLQAGVQAAHERRRNEVTTLTAAALARLETRSSIKPSRRPNRCEQQTFASYAVIKFTRPPAAEKWTQMYSITQVVEEHDPLRAAAVLPWVTGRAAITAETLGQFLAGTFEPDAAATTETHRWAVTVHDGPPDGSATAYVVRQCAIVSKNYRVQIWYPVPSTGQIKFRIDQRFLPPMGDITATRNVGLLIRGLSKFPNLFDPNRCVAVDLNTRVLIDPRATVTLRSKIAVIYFLPSLFPDFELTAAWRACKGCIVTAAFDDNRRTTETLMVLPRTRVRHVAQYLRLVGKLKPDEGVRFQPRPGDVDLAAAEEENLKITETQEDLDPDGRENEEEDIGDPGEAAATVRITALTFPLPPPPVPGASTAASTQTNVEIRSDVLLCVTTRRPTGASQLLHGDRFLQPSNSNDDDSRRGGALLPYALRGHRADRTPISFLRQVVNQLTECYPPQEFVFGGDAKSGGDVRMSFEDSLGSIRVHEVTDLTPLSRRAADRRVHIGPQRSLLVPQLRCRSHRHATCYSREWFFGITGLRAVFECSLVAHAAIGVGVLAHGRRWESSEHLLGAEGFPESLGCLLLDGSVLVMCGGRVLHHETLPFLDGAHATVVKTTTAAVHERSKTVRVAIRVENGGQVSFAVNDRPLGFVWQPSAPECDWTQRPLRLGASMSQRRQCIVLRSCVPLYEWRRHDGGHPDGNDIDNNDGDLKRRGFLFCNPHRQESSDGGGGDVGAEDTAAPPIMSKHARLFVCLRDTANASTLFSYQAFRGHDTVSLKVKIHAGGAGGGGGGGGVRIGVLLADQIHACAFRALGDSYLAGSIGVGLHPPRGLLVFHLGKTTFIDQSSLWAGTAPTDDWVLQVELVDGFLRCVVWAGAVEAAAVGLSIREQLRLSGHRWYRLGISMRGPAGKSVEVLEASAPVEPTVATGTGNAESGDDTTNDGGLGRHDRQNPSCAHPPDQGPAPHHPGTGHPSDRGDDDDSSDGSDPSDDDAGGGGPTSGPNRVFAACYAEGDPIASGGQGTIYRCWPIAAAPTPHPGPMRYPPSPPPRPVDAPFCSKRYHSDGIRKNPQTWKARQDLKEEGGNLQACAASKKQHIGKMFFAKYQDLFDDGPERRLVAEYVRGDSLSRVVERFRAQGARLSWRLARAKQWTEQLLLAVHWLDGCGIVHDDLKPGNIVVTPHDHDQGDVRIIDFGLSKRHGVAASRGGTSAYDAPEKFLHDRGGRRDDNDNDLSDPIHRQAWAYANRNDVWAVGCIAFEVVTLVRYDELPERENPFEIDWAAVDRQARSEEGRDFSDELMKYKDFILRVLAPWERRATALDALRSTWFRGDALDGTPAALDGAAVGYAWSESA